MKKILLILLAITMCISLCACSSSIEGMTLSYTGPGNYKCTATFNNGKMHFTSPVTNETFDYELKDDNTIVLEGSITYTYEIDDGKVTFSGNFMGVSKTWYE